MSTILKTNCDINLIKYECGLYAVDKINKAIGITLMTDFNKDLVIEYYNKCITK